ncbi:hypothetical protein FBEOM_3163 [Fusarium beomiforme]|uniref:Fucose-specific lectin n=1 Tax=Fusarium beomiforme TaxID=44412 RepID=A0A9P5AQJ6_9HYPO|nr:hypothetical protein FBEOM_3163 [Fusarium beomiforme]
MDSSLPKDIAAVESGGKNYIFYVNDSHQLSYIVKAGGGCNGGYAAEIIEITYQRMHVKCDSREVAAVAWKTPNGVDEIRVYCVISDDCNKGVLQEVCLSSDKPERKWYQGLLGSKNVLRYVENGASISATGTSFSNLKVYVSGKDRNGLPRIDTHYYVGENGGGWAVESANDQLSS